MAEWEEAEIKRGGWGNGRNAHAMPQMQWQRWQPANGVEGEGEMVSLHQSLCPKAGPEGGEGCSCLCCAWLEAGCWIRWACGLTSQGSS